jgi:hypothetical protein
MGRLALVLILSVAALVVSAERSPATPSGSYVVVEITGFFGPDCSAARIDISNQGDAEQPFGWTLTLRVPNVGISQTFVGQQPLAPGEHRLSAIGTGITAAGTYPVRISPGDVSGGSKSGHAVLRLPATC